MGIFSRFTDIVNSNINAILDKAEDPEKMVRLIIQEMEDTLVEVRSVSARNIAEKKELQRQIDKLSAGAQDWQHKAELALTKNREDLARGALLEKQKMLDKVAIVQQELDIVEQHLAKLQDEIAALQEKLQDAKARQKSIVLRQQSAQSRLDIKRTLDSSKVDDALTRFERFEMKVDSVESEVEAYELGKKSLADEIAELQQTEKIDDELAALKQKLQQDKK